MKLSRVRTRFLSL